MLSEFNANDYYCVEYKGANDLTESEKEAYRQKTIENMQKSAFREYAKKYYTKKQAKQMIKNFNDKLKGK